MEKLDRAPDLLGFEDGVYDLRSHQFRDGRPDDFVSFSTKLYYYPEDEEEQHSENHPKLKKLENLCHKFFNQMQRLRLNPIYGFSMW